MHIDAFTAMTAMITVVVLLAVQVFFFWYQDRRSAWLGWLVGPFVFGAAGLALLVTRWKTQDFVTVGVAYALLIVSLGLAWQGARAFERRPPMLWPVVGLAMLWLALALVPGFRDSLAIRMAVISAICASFCVLGALELWRGRTENLPSRWPAILALCSFATFLLARVAFTGIAPFPLGAQPMEGWAVGVTNLLVFGHLSALTMFMVSLTKERRELEHRNDALTDALTGLANRRAFTAQSHRLAYRRKFGREQTSVLALDLDHFKRVNDTYGHEAGDKVLLAFASVAESALGASDRLYRMGGEEFCFVLPNSSLAEAVSAAERIRISFEALLIPIGDEEIAATVSIGIATTDFAGFDLEVLLAAADAALYEAKARGRNRIVVADPTSLTRPQTSPVRRASA